MATILSVQLKTIGALVHGEPTRLRLRRDSVSAWDIGQQVDHMLKVCERVFGIIGKGEAMELPGITPRGRLVLTLKWIPRGRGKSPEPVVGLQSSAEELVQLFARVSSLASALMEKESLDQRTRIFKHPYFGGLTAAQAFRFVEIHNKHHLKIIRDISTE